MFGMGRADISGEITERIDDPSYQGGDSTICILGLQNPACVWGATKGRGSQPFRLLELRAGS